MKKTIAVLLLSGLVVAACGDSTEVAEVPTSEVSDPLPTADDDATFPSGMGPGISVQEALDSTLDELLLVNGYVFVYADGTVVISDAIAESFPPQPGGAQMTVEGVDLMQLPLTEGPEGGDIEIVAWTDMPVQLLGDVVDGAFVGNSVASA